MLLTLLLACSSSEDTAVADTPVDTATSDSATDSGVETFPDVPDGFTIQLAGARTDALVFDTPSCSLNGTSLRTFWRNGAGQHVFVLIAEIMGQYAGPGAYDATRGVRLKLQEEAGGTLAYFAADSAQGDAIAVDVTAGDAYRAAGTATVGGMRGTEGSITFAPATWPIWCVTEPPP